MYMHANFLKTYNTEIKSVHGGFTTTHGVESTNVFSKSATLFNIVFLWLVYRDCLFISVTLLPGKVHYIIILLFVNI